MLLKRYGTIDYIMQMPLIDGLSMIAKAIENNTKDKCYQMFVIERIFMDEPMNFETYYKSMTRTVKKANKEEIYAKVDNILNHVLKKGGESSGDI